MIRITKILCPVDFFPASEYAAEYAAGLAKNYGAKLKLFHVISPVIPTVYEYPLNMASVIETMQDEAKAKLDKLVRRFRASGIDVESEGRTGEIVAEIKRAIEAYKPDLVAMGTHGRKSIGRWFLGSTTERMLRHSPVPLLTISTPKPAGGRKELRRILATTDFSEGTADALNYAFSIGQENQTRVTLLHVMQDTSFVQGGPLIRGLKYKLSKLAPEDVKDWCDVETRIEEGTPYQRILETLKKDKIDLLVMNIHGKGMLDRAILGSNAERVVRGAECPVLLIPPMTKPVKTRTRKRAA